MENLKQIEFKEPKDYLKQKLKKLDKYRYRTKHEKEVLIHDESDDPFMYLDLITDTLPKDLYPKNEVECLVYLVYLRSISVSDFSHAFRHFRGRPSRGMGICARPPRHGGALALRAWPGRCEP